MIKICERCYTTLKNRGIVVCIEIFPFNGKLKVVNLINARNPRGHDICTWFHNYLVWRNHLFSKQL